LGGGHALALKTNNSLWAWGRNDAGQLGDSTTVIKTTPIPIGSSTDWLSISTGSYHNLALKTNGTIWAWGLNQNGQLGMETDEDILIVPTQMGTDADWKFIYAHESQSFAIKTNGTLWAWGYSESGQFGTDTTENYFFPVQMGEDTDWEDVVTGDYVTIARKTNGTLWAWGWNKFGHLGTGTTTFIPCLKGEKCGNDLSIITIDKKNDLFTIYPNPFYSAFYIKSHADEIKTIAIYDIMGREIKNQTINQHEARISADDLNTGLYLLKICTQNGVYMGKIIKR
jgi:hypothetical protein